MLSQINIRQIENTLEQHYEVKVKCVSGKITVHRVKRKLLLKANDKEEVKKSIDELYHILLADEPNTKIEMKLENNRIVAVLVREKVI